MEPAGRLGRAVSPALLLLAGCLLAGSVGDAHAQSICSTTWEAAVAPTLFRDGAGELAPGLGVSAEACRSEHDTQAAFSRSAYFGGELRAKVPFRTLQLPQNLSASAQLGLSISLSERRPIDLDDDPDQDFYRFNYGFLGLGGRARYEASTDLDEQAMVAGLEVRWVDPSRPVLPSVVLTAEGVSPTRSHLRDSLALERDGYARLEARGYWLIPVAESWAVELDTGYFRSFGLDPVLVDAGVEDGGYLAPAVEYRWGAPVAGVEIRSVALSYAHGRRPTGVASEKAWTLGLEVGPRR